ncbi:MAG: hypothetical protein WC372_01925 [Candidatus Neomarinimicrobiota bacterium]|nr:hypothetical protein [Candidatus Neomarinimicrobiota bacterium]
MPKIIECVPNFSEGRDMNIIKQITDVIMKPLYLFLIILLFIIGCFNPPVTQDQAIKILDLDGSDYETDLDYPYLYIAARTEGLLRIDLSNSNYTIENLPLLDLFENVIPVEYISASGNDIVALSSDDIWHSSDNGYTWENINHGISIPYGLTALSRSPVESEKLFVISQGDSMYYSPDNGEHWQAGIYAGHSSYYNSYWNPYIDGDIWFNGLGQLGWPFFGCVENHGQLSKVFDQANLPEINNCSGMVFSQNRIYISNLLQTKSRFYYSEDGGSSWSEMEQTLDDSTYIDYFIKDQLASGTFYLATSDDNILISSDTLKTFNKVCEFSNNTDDDFAYKLYHESINNFLIITTTQNNFYLYNLNEN